MSRQGGEGRPLRGGGGPAGGPAAGEEPAPVGTLFLLMLYLMLLAGMWGTMYWILLTR